MKHNSGDRMKGWKVTDGGLSGRLLQWDWMNSSGVGQQLWDSKTAVRQFQRQNQQDLVTNWIWG